jgi:hypothetical protein
VNALVAATENSANWGLKFFADTGSCGVSGGVAVPITTGNAAVIANAIAARTNASGDVSNPSNTPTRAAEVAAASYLPPLGSQGRKLILLVTDGATNCGPGDINADDSAAAIQAIADAFSAGFPTIVVGTSAPGGPTDAALTAMATAGGYARAGASPAYYPLSAVGDLAGTIADATFSITDCVYEGIPVGPSSDAEPKIGVLVDGVAIPRDDGSGTGWAWARADFSAVRFLGPLCDDLTAGMHQVVTFVFYCPDTR